ncbi:MAG TPA: hypothetical protein VM716_01895 [Gemmatimonadales bacterium]|nr:hypothetical protein [Gemmatimonadales bacterium]
MTRYGHTRPTRFGLVLVVLPALAAGIIGCGTEKGPTRPAPPQLAFIVQPTVTTDAQAIPMVQVAVRDASGNTVTTSKDPVTLALEANPDNATLSGTLTVTAVQGIATFSDLLINRPGSGYTLSASAPGLTGAVSTPFPITLAFAAVSGGGTHTCGVTTVGQGYCWGDDVFGMLGSGTASPFDRLTPVPVAGGLVFTAVNPGGWHTCGVTTGGAA